MKNKIKGIFRIVAGGMRLTVCLGIATAGYIWVTIIDRNEVK